jgi:hypothetical protein
MLVADLKMRADCVIGGLGAAWWAQVPSVCTFSAQRVMRGLVLALNQLVTGDRFHFHDDAV